ncbi:galactokinase [Nocardioides gansuensis]|uniref:galactokinase n=1 Tax=Nocardioides gansuensis TaxID=2138300 RepID=UPI001FE3335A|nr:galactokinase [Nocardioides gansuensis]
MATWRAPGRVNLIGEHTDYNDGFTLPFAIAASCTATVRPGGDGLRAGSAQVDGEVAIPLTGLAEAPAVPDWARYVLGAAWLLRDRGVDVPPLEVTVDSDVPSGAGLSSSAAVVCSVVTALDDALGLGLAPDELLALSRAVENDVVGAPTGGMDQLASLRSREGHVLFCDMRDLAAEPVPFDLGGAGLALLVVDSRAPHAHADGEYAARRRGCEAAAAALGVPALRDVVIDDLDAALARLDGVGAEEQRRYTRHIVTEDARVLQTVELLRAGRVREIGPLLTQSHVSMRDDFRITVPEVDTAVEVLLAGGALGARMTGGGFGGCVIGLLEAEAVESAAAQVEEAFAEAGFTPPVAFTVTPGPGAHRVDG